MRGAGGPLLCISDLLSDVAEDKDGDPRHNPPPPDAAVLDLPPSNLPYLFQENFAQLNAALKGTDHSWTTLTLKLCSALETANGLMESTNSDALLFSQKVEAIQQLVKRRDSVVVSAANAIHIFPDKDMTKILIYQSTRP